MDEAKLAELEQSAHRMAESIGLVYMKSAEAYSLIAAAREALTMRRLIEEHNAGQSAECAARSEADGYAGICAAHRRTARGCCPDCPQRDVIPLP